MIQARNALLLCAALVSSAPCGAAAQVSAISLGQTLSGRLEASDPKLDDDSHYDLYLFRGNPGERILITLRSPDFDVYLAWGAWDGAAFTEEKSDDDSGGGTDARLRATIGAGGSYAIRANSVEADETGGYTISVERLEQRPVTPQTIDLGQTVAGELEPTDPVADDDSLYDLFLYRGQAGERIRVTLRSEDFDAYLAVGQWDGADFSEEASDDDGGGDTDAQLAVTVGSSGTAAMRANSLSSGETGAYTLTVERDQGAPAAGPAAPQASRQFFYVDRFPMDIAVGQTVTGRLEASDPLADDDSYYDLYVLSAQAGAEVVITLHSPDFDSYLAWGVMEAGGFRELESDDDSAGGTDARLTVSVGTSGTYAIRANSLESKVTGEYTLSVRQGGR